MDKTRLLAIFLVLFLAGDLRVIAAKEPIKFKSLGDHAKDIYEWYGNPAEEAANGIPKIIKGELTDEGIAGLTEERIGEALSYIGPEERVWSTSLLGYYLPHIELPINENCRYDTTETILAWTLYLNLLIQKGSFWQIIMPDSWGKIGDGILNGNNFAWGFKEECVDTIAKDYIEYPSPFIPPLNVSFKGNYCLVHIRNATSVMNMKDTRFDIDIDDATQVALDILETPTEWSYGTCISSRCSSKDMKVSVEHELNNTDWEVVDVECRTNDEAGELTSSDVAFIVIVSLMWFLIIGAAIVDLTINLYNAHQYRKGSLKYLLAFSAYSNMQSIFRITNKTNPEVIDCLHGMRALSMIWVTWTHSYTLFLKVTQNLLGLKPFTSNIATQIIFNGSFSVDTFFFMSGLLAAYSVLREHAITGRVSWIMYYIHRIIRLLPSIALTCFFMATVARHAVVGPYGPYVDKENLQNCRDYWYMDVLFASNYVDASGRCLPQSWYTSLDAQLYAILPVILVPLILRPKIGLGLLSLATIASFVIPTSLYYAYSLKPYLPFVIPDFIPEEMSLNQNTVPWNRASPYFVGVFAGWLLFRYRDRKLNISWVVAIIGWLLSATIASLVLFGMAAYNTLDEPEVLPSGVSIAYGGFSRGAWGLALFWVVIAARRVMEFIETCGYLFVSGLMAIGISITAELPFLSFEKALIPRQGRNVQEETPKES